MIRLVLWELQNPYSWETADVLSHNRFKVLWDEDSTITFGRLFQNGIVLGNKLNLKDSVLHL